MKRARDGLEAGDMAEAGDGTSGGAGTSSGIAAAPAAGTSQSTASRAALAALPCCEMYERSFMHRDRITHIVCTTTDFVVTGSCDGQIKFWKKMVQQGIEFVKHFRAHLAPIACMAATADGSLLATTAPDKAFKVFDVLSFDMISWVKLDFTPGACEWVGGGSSRSAQPLLAVADVDAPQLRLFNASDDGSLVRSVSVHSAPVLHVRLNAAKETVVSVDSRGVLEYWAIDSGEQPKHVSFRHKTETDLYTIAKARAAPTSLAISPDGEHFAVTADDFKVRLFHYTSGKCLRSFDESYDAMHQLQRDGDDAYRLEAFDFGRRMAVEREYRAAGASASASNVIFDASGRFLIYASVVGIKVISVRSSRLARLLGKVENTERFTTLALFQGRAKVGANMIGSGLKIVEEDDPIIFCAAFKKSRFYLFSRREPEEPEGDDQPGRDVFNEKVFHTSQLECCAGPHSHFPSTPVAR